MKNIYIPIFIENPYYKREILDWFNEDNAFSSKLLRDDINQSALNSDLTKKFDFKMVNYERNEIPFLKVMIKEKPNYNVTANETLEMVELLKQMHRNQDIFTEPYFANDLTHDDYNLYSENVKIGNDGENYYFFDNESILDFLMTEIPLNSPMTQTDQIDLQHLTYLSDYLPESINCHQYISPSILSEKEESYLKDRLEKLSDNEIENLNSVLKTVEVDNVVNFIELLDKLPELNPIKDVTNDEELGEHTKKEILGDIESLEHITEYIDTKKLGESKRLKEDLTYDDNQCLCTKGIREHLEYFKGKTTCDHGIKILMTNKTGTKNVWVNPYNLLTDDPLKSDELLRATSSLGLQSPEELRVKHIECVALGFKKSFPISKKLSSQDYENIATLSAILVSLEKDGNTNLFKEFIQKNNVKEVSEIIDLHDNFIKNSDMALVTNETIISICKEKRNTYRPCTLYRQNLCKNCLHIKEDKLKKTKKYKGEFCPYMKERIIAKDIDPIIALGIAEQGFIQPNKNLFLSGTHNAYFNYFYSINENLKYDNFSLAMTYLLSYSGELCNSFNGIDIKKEIFKIQNKQHLIESYTILCILKDFISHTSYTTIIDYKNSNIISPEITALVFNTLIIGNYGLKSKYY